MDSIAMWSMTVVHTGPGSFVRPFVCLCMERFLVMAAKIGWGRLLHAWALGKVAEPSPFTDKKIKAQKNGAPQPGHGGWKGTIWGAYVSARDGWPEGRGTWGDPGCLLSLDWLRPMVSTNLSFLLCKWLMTLGDFQELFIPRGQEEIVSGKAVPEDGEAQTFAQIAWNSMSRSNSRSLPLLLKVVLSTKGFSEGQGDVQFPVECDWGFGPSLIFVGS